MPRLFTVPEKVQVDAQVSDEELDIESITASVLGLSFPPVFGGSRGFKSNVLFKDLAEFYKEIQLASVRLETSYRAFSKSKKDISKLEQTTGKATRDTTKVYKWSLSALAKLVDAIENAEAMWLQWETNENNLLQICTNDPTNPKCWKIQTNVAQITNALKKKVAKYDNELQNFIDKSGDFVEQRLYIDPTWAKADTAGKSYIYNKSDEKETYWLSRMLKTTAGNVDADTLDEEV